LYEIIAWGSISPSSVQHSLQLAQNNAIRAIVGAKNSIALCVSAKN